MGVRRIRPISHEERLSVVDHLDELRSRLIVCAVAFCVAWALTAWQNHLVLEIINAPLPNDIQPITLGPAEAFYSTLTNAAYVALLISLPVILYQIYAFLLPAFSPTEKRVALPIMLMIPLLFITGVVFCYFVPTVLSNAGFIPLDSELYVFIRRVLLPASLLLLVLATDGVSGWTPLTAGPSTGLAAGHLQGPKNSVSQVRTTSFPWSGY